MRGYKVCSECGQPMLKKGQKHPDDYRHAMGCPKAPKRERDATERKWKKWYEALKRIPNE